MPEINKCLEPHPERLEVLCDNDPHPWGYHTSKDYDLTWAGLPYPTAKKSPRAKKADTINKIPAETRTGPPTGTMLKERVEGIRRVTHNTPQEWAEAFDRHVESLATGTQFDVYDVLDVVGKPEGVHPSAIGARMRIASRKGLVVKIGHAERVTHGDDVSLWERTP